MNHKLHVALIMDGNGRWAKMRGENRTKGHEAGAQVIRTITEYAARDTHIGILTLYAFSTENWKRPKSEVTFLMKLLERYLDQEEATLLENNIRFCAIGDRSTFSKTLQKKLTRLEAITADGTALTQVLALNYGGRDEIVRSVQKLIDAGITPSEEAIKKMLDMPQDVDVLIRTGGNQRISNFMLWQASYAELFFTQTLWPDFSAQEFGAILDQFYAIERRFGGILS